MVFRYRDEKGRRGTYTRQVILIVFTHFSCFLSICLKTGDLRYLIFYAVFQILILLIVESVPMLYPRVNRLLINNSCMLISIGIIMLTRLDINEAFKQLIVTAVSFLIAMFIPLIMTKMNGIPNKPYIYALIGIVLLASVNMLGVITNGSKLSITIFGVSFMPSEFVKITFVLFLAGLLCLGNDIKSLIIATVLAAIHVLILAMSNDLGAALILFVVFVLLVFVATKNYIYLSIGTLAGCSISYLAYFLFRHVRVRVAAFIDPFSVIDKEGYQITQSLFALSSGGWFGTGLFNGTPDNIPYVETDFIFSAITQELGILFSIDLVLICLSCFLMFINISFKFRDSFYKYVSIGFGITYIFQIFLTVGGGIKFIPLTGVTLPLVSYGGSSIMATIFTVFIIEGLYVIRGKSIQNVSNSISEKDVKKQNRIVLALSYFFSALFIVMLTRLSIYVVNNKQELINNSYNPMQEVLLEHNIRGSIYSRNNEILAETLVDKEGNETRFYPFYSFFSHVVGYSTNGNTGIEAQANYYLINSNQPLTERVSADLNGKKYIGDGVVTTLDVPLQTVAYSALGNYSGAIVVSNPKTGEIYACVSKPDFDPNEINDIWNDLLNDSSSSVLLNRATQGLYPPGSTFKIITLLEYIKENPESFEKYYFNCPGYLQVENGKIICYNKHAHGGVNLKSSFAKSCNSSFGNIGLMLDRKAFNKTLDSLLFNSDLPLSMNYSRSKANVSQDFDELTMVRTAFGQGETLMTPMHLNMITSAIANDGVLMKPYLISSVVNSNMNTVESFKSEEYKTLMTKEEAEILKEYMRAVVTSGTGTKLKSNLYSACGKTGSAEFSDFSSATHSWFTGFAPEENPEICVTIILENAGSGNLRAVPMAKRIFDEYFRRFDTSEYKDINE